MRNRYIHELLSAISEVENLLKALALQLRCFWSLKENFSTEKWRSCFVRRQSKERIKRINKMQRNFCKFLPAINLCLISPYYWSLLQIEGIRKYSNQMTNLWNSPIFWYQTRGRYLARIDEHAQWDMSARECEGFIILSCCLCFPESCLAWIRKGDISISACVFSYFAMYSTHLCLMPRNRPVVKSQSIFGAISHPRCHWCMNYRILEKTNPIFLLFVVKNMKKIEKSNLCISTIFGKEEKVNRSSKK